MALKLHTGAYGTYLEALPKDLVTLLNLIGDDPELTQFGERMALHQDDLAIGAHRTAKKESPKDWESPRNTRMVRILDDEIEVVRTLLADSELPGSTAVAEQME